QHDGSAALLQCFGERFNFEAWITVRSAFEVGNVVAFDIINAPTGILLCNVSIPGLTGFGGSIHTIHIVVPPALARDIANGARGLRRAKIRTLNRQILFDRPTRNTAHDVDAKLQTHRVQFIGKRSEPEPANCGRKAIGWRNASTKFVQNDALRTLYANA